MYERDLEGLPEELKRAHMLINAAKVDEATQILKSFQASDNRSTREIAYCHYLEAELLTYQGKYMKVIKHCDLVYHESIEMEGFLAIDALLLKIYAIASMERNDEAKILIKKAEELLKSKENHSKTDYKLREATMILYKSQIEFRFEPDRRIELLEQSLRIREEVGLKEDIAQSLFWLASAFALQKGEFDLAVEYVERSLSLAKEIKNQVKIYAAMFFAASIYGLKGEIDHSIELNQGALNIVKEYGNKVWLVPILNNLSGDYSMRGQTEEALACIKKAIEISQELGLKRNEAQKYDFLIQFLLQKGDIEQAKTALL
ncbi:MAG: tetratricopeptide repeat protein, partial [Promethearchaeota archaeon]